MRTLVGFLLLSVVVLVVGCEERIVTPDAATKEERLTDAQEAISKKGPPLSATVTFGKDVGSPFPPDSGHDRSDHARDSMKPRNVVISAGGTVTFNIGVFHRVAVYAAGTRPEDIDESATVDLTSPFFIPGFVIDDPNGRLAVAWPNAGELFLTPTSWSFTFAAPGKYLIICTTLPHFADAAMYGWVDVK